MMQINTRLALLTLALALLSVTGCGDATMHLLTSIMPVKSVDTDELIPMQFPAEAPYADSLDIEVVRTDRRQIRFDNRSAHALTNVEIFINEEFGTTIESIPVGKPVTFALKGFVNHFGESFPTGSFLEPEKSKTIIKADVMVDGKLHNLTVRLEKNWQRAQRD